MPGTTTVLNRTLTSDQIHYAKNRPANSCTKKVKRSTFVFWVNRSTGLAFLPWHIMRHKMVVAVLTKFGPGYCRTDDSPASLSQHM